MTHCKSNNLYGEIHRVDNQNTSYIFGFKRDNVWTFAPRRFILYGLNAKLYGQFISSTWFNQKLREDKVEYMLLGINKSFKYSDITQTINSYDIDSNNLNISQEESGMGITFKDKFTISKDMIDENICEGEEKKIAINNNITLGNQVKSQTVVPHRIISATISLDGKYDKSKLSLSINKLSNGNIYITLPDFMLKYDS